MISIWNFLNGLMDILNEMSPYLLFGFAVAGVLSVLVSQKTVERHIGGRGFLSVFKAALFGVPLPLCSCGVIPVAASLRKHGASRGATMAFLLSTPQTGMDSILVTYGLLGPLFAIYRPIAAFITGLLGGTLVDALETEAEKTEPPPQCEDDCCSGKTKHNKLIGSLKFAFVTLPADIGRPLFVGLLVSGVISALIPPDFFAYSIGTGVGAMMVMMLLGIPLYVCATASVPIAVALIAKGVSPGAALVFLIAGPATNAAAIATIWKVLGRKTTFIYICTIAVSSLAAGLTLDFIFTTGLSIATCHGQGEMIPGWIGMTSSILLLIMLAPSLFRVKHKPHHEEKHAGHEHTDKSHSCCHDKKHD